MNEIQNLTSDCKFVIEEEQKSYLNCKLNIENYKDIKLFTFKTFEISNENKTIFLNDLDKVILINEVKNVKKNKVFIIVAALISGIVVIGIIILIIYLFLRNKKKVINNKKIELNKEVLQNKTKNKNDGQNSKLFLIKYTNKNLI